jgi:hypothetical protein
MEDTNGRDPLQDAYEEQIDGAKYLKQAIHDRRALLEYVARLEGALREIAGPPNEPDVDGLIEDWTCCYCDENSLEGCAENCPRTIATDTLATSPLSGQPQSAPATGWRPIAEAPRDGTPIEAGDPDSGFVRVVQYASECGGAWYLLGSADTHYAFDSFTVFRPVPVVPAPPQEGE